MTIEPSKSRRHKWIIILYFTGGIGENLLPAPYGNEWNWLPADGFFPEERIHDLATLFGMIHKWIESYFSIIKSRDEVIHILRRIGEEDMEPGQGVVLWGQLLSLVTGSIR